MNFQKFLLLNVRPHHARDFSLISDLINQRAPYIGVLGRPGDLASLHSPPALLAAPHLNIYLVNPPLQLPHQGRTLMVERISKYEQYQSYIRVGIQTPLTSQIAESEPLPVDVWGDHVIVKPGRESFGRGVALVETKMLNQVIEQRGQEYQGLVAGDYLVQQYVDTGLYQDKFRVTVFLGEVILCYRVIYRKEASLPRYSTLTKAIEDGYFTAAGLKYQLVNDPQLNEFARRAYYANPQCPLQGLDIQRDKDGKFFVIENNAGGNVWKFSDMDTAPYKVFGPKRMQGQFGAWHLCADALIQAVNELAC